MRSAVRFPFSEERCLGRIFPDEAVEAKLPCDAAHKPHSASGMLTKESVEDSLERFDSVIGFLDGLVHQYLVLIFGLEMEKILHRDAILAPVPVQIPPFCSECTSRCVLSPVPVLRVSLYPTSRPMVNKSTVRAMGILSLPAVTR